MNPLTLSPTAEQAHILDLISSTKDNLLVNALAGCIAEGTIISLRRGNDLTVRKRPIESLLQLRKPEVPTLVLCDMDGYTGYRPMIGFGYSGPKPTIRVETTFGELIATPDHQVKTDRGWIEVGSVKAKDRIYTRAKSATGRTSGRITIYSIKHHPFAHEHNVDVYGNYKRLPRARLVVEAYMNNISLEEMILTVRHNPYKAATLTYLDPDQEVHHKNELPWDDRFENLEVLSPEEHKTRHKAHIEHTRLGLSDVIAVTNAGRRHTYDISMPAPYHNFLANGHVVHNCGKTSTLELIQNAARPPVLCLAFNRRIADEMGKRFLTTTTVRTLNGLGHRIWSSACANRLSLDPKKCQDLLRESIRSLSKADQNEAYSSFWEIISAVGLAKSLGYVPTGKYKQVSGLLSQTEFYAKLDEEPSELAQDLIEEVLTSSIKAAYSGSIDYNDQVYMPALFGGTYPKFPLVLIDEAQDLSPVNHEMLNHLSKSRLVAVGDRYQSIYGFRGAVQGGMSKLKARFSMIEADLSISFRCPEAIVRAAHWRVPHMKWIKGGGRAARLHNPSSSSFLDGCAIICRNNAPLFALALRLLSSGRSVSVSGSDVGPKIIGIMKRLADPSTNQKGVLHAIESWRQEKLTKQSTSANDIADCMRVFAGFGDTLSQAISYADHLFAQRGAIQLLTGHKAKGLEWPTVYHLDPFLLRDDEQDLNLRYVVQTRAMESYYEIESREIRWE